MTPPRKRQVRLVVSLTLAVVLAGGLIYTSFSAADPALTPSQLIRQGKPGSDIQLTGVVVKHSVRDLRNGAVDFALADRSGGGPTVEVDYSGSVPPTFEVGRELIVTGELRGRTFVAQPSSMVTKCPSKYTAAPSST
ncbi:MAG: cytochrome c maturation protein CcmE [Solirubrobacteraceae bacterium]|jgi:cytochrome c-type biogenesis protein CcmE